MTALWLEFVENHLCALCANTGIVNTLGIRSHAGTPSGIRTYCICPNGRAMKRGDADLEQWLDGKQTRQ